MEVKEDDFVLCTVKQIDPAVVFVELESGEKGSIAMSEIAAGRIRNLREYVVPNKKIVCKILRKTPNHIELSLRRVTGRERDELLEKYKKEKTASALLKAALKNSDSALEGIKKDMTLSEFVAKARADIGSAAKYLGKAELASLEKILAEKKEKQKAAKKTISLKSNSPDGLVEIKEVLAVKGVEVNYLGSGKFSIEASASDFKEANHTVESAIEQMQKRAKEKKMIFEAK
jgi:translation initiation factor 2 alpha subunit (eIF-2alpha)